MLLKQSIFAILMIFFWAVLTVLPGLAVATDRELEARITEAKILKPGDAIATSTNGDEAIIRKYGASNEKDCKIEAVLISKEVMSADPGIKKVRVMFFDPGERSRYSEVLVRAGFIKAFASGALSQADLLSSLDIVQRGEKIAPPASPPNPATPPSGETAGLPATESKAAAADTSGGADAGQTGSVSSGQFADDMKRNLERINKLSKAVNTEPYMKQYHIVENFIKTGNISQTRTEMDRLDVALKSQEKALEQKRLGIHSTSSSSSSTASTPSSASDLQEVLGQSFGVGSGPGSRTFEAFMKRMVSPKFITVPGPFMMERNYIAGTIMEKRKAGVDISKYEAMFKDLNDCARSGNSTQVYYKVQSAYKVLGIAQIGMEMWKTRMYREMWGQR